MKKKAKKKRYDTDYVLPLAGMKNLRLMVAGESRIFSVGDRKPSGMFSGAANASRASNLCGMETTQRTMLLVDPVTYKSIPVLLIHCKKPAKQSLKRGRKNDECDKKIHDLQYSTDEEGTVLYRGT